MGVNIISSQLQSPLNYGEEVVGRVTNMMPHPKTGVMPEMAIIAGARTSFLGHSGDLARDQKLLTYLHQHEHSSPFELAEIVLELEMSDREWYEMLEDSRIRMMTLRPMRSGNETNSSSSQIGQIKIDANNFIKFLQWNPTPLPQSKLKKALSGIVPIAFPWLSPLLGMKAANGVDHDDALPPARRQVLNDACWIQPLEINSSDQMLADTIRFHRPDIGLNPEDFEAIIYEMFRLGDLRPMSLFSIRFLMRAPVVTFWQWTRHRTFNFSLQSGRYTEFDESDFLVPIDWRKQSKSNKQGSSTERLTEEDYGELIADWVEHHAVLKGLVEEYDINSPSQMLTIYDALGHRLYQSLLRHGVAREQARFFLPAWGSLYTAVLKVDLMNLMRFLRLRTAGDAQLEIRQYADELYRVWAEAMPATARIAKDFNYNGA